MKSSTDRVLNCGGHHDVLLLYLSDFFPSLRVVGEERFVVVVLKGVRLTREKVDLMKRLDQIHIVGECRSQEKTNAI